MTTPTAAAPQFRLPRTSTLRDVAIFALCVALVGAFLLQIWRAPAPAPEPVRPVAAPTSLNMRA